jgi:hypothetical protein
VNTADSSRPKAASLVSMTLLVVHGSPTPENSRRGPKHHDGHLHCATLRSATRHRAPGRPQN